jgi:hypothetical protein
LHLEISAKDQNDLDATIRGLPLSFFNSFSTCISSHVQEAAEAQEQAAVAAIGAMAAAMAPKKNAAEQALGAMSAAMLAPKGAAFFHAAAGQALTLKDDKEVKAATAASAVSGRSRPGSIETISRFRLMSSPRPLAGCLYSARTAALRLLHAFF